MRLHVCTRDNWTGRRGLEVSWYGNGRVEWGVVIGFGMAPIAQFRRVPK